MKDSPSSIPKYRDSVTTMEIQRYPPPPQPPIPHSARVSIKMINYSELIHPPRVSLEQFIEAPFFKITIKVTKEQRCAAVPAKRLCN